MNDVRRAVAVLIAFVVGPGKPIGARIMMGLRRHTAVSLFVGSMVGALGFFGVPSVIAVTTAKSISPHLVDSISRIESWDPVQNGFTPRLGSCLPCLSWFHARLEPWGMVWIETQVGQQEVQKDERKNGNQEEKEGGKQDDKRSLIRPTAPTDANKLADRPPKPEIIYPPGQPRPERYDLTFDDLAFDIPEGKPFDWAMVTDEIHKYDGMKITLRGYIRPAFTQRNLKQFVFVRDNQECCFGPGAALFDCVLVKMKEGSETDFTVRPVTLEGEFYLRKYAGPDGNVWAIFRMKETKVKR